VKYCDSINPFISVVTSAKSSDHHNYYSCCTFSSRGKKLRPESYERAYGSRIDGLDDRIGSDWIASGLAVWFDESIILRIHPKQKGKGAKAPPIVHIDETTISRPES
jgi:hypothetical protein